jgi:hypothetical protein
MEMESILHENQSLVQEIRSEATAKNVFKGNENGQLHKRQQPEINGGERTRKVMENGTVSESDSSEKSWAFRKKGKGF